MKKQIQTESDIEMDFEPLHMDLDCFNDPGDPDVDLNLDLDRPSTSSRPTGGGQGNWSTVLKPIEVEEFTEFTGLKVDLTESSLPRDYFDLFCPQEMISHIIQQTNRYAEMRTQIKPEKYWVPVTYEDISNYIYILIMFGIHQLPDYKMYWSSDPLLHVKQVSDVMGRCRFESIHRYFHLNDAVQGERDSEGFDPMLKVRPLLDQVRSACLNLYAPSCELSIDEGMIGFKGRVYFRQYLPSKPQRYGIKFWCCAESKSGYVLNFQFYTGKNEDFDKNIGLGHHVVKSIATPFLNRNHHLFFDNFFSSLALTKDLLDKKTYSCSTTRANRKGWPLRDGKKQKKGEVKMLQDGNIVATQWTDKRTVNMLSSQSSPEMTPTSRRSRSGPVEVQIPKSVESYNNFMAGVDLADQYRSYYPVGRASHKWWRYVFNFLLQISIINAFLLMKKNVSTAKRDSPARSHVYFRLELCRSLLRQGRKRASAPEVASVSSYKCAKQEAHDCVRMPGRHRRCYQCARDGKKTGAGRTPETVYGCPTCNIRLCKGLCFSKFHNF